MNRKFRAAVLAVSLSSCGGVPVQPADPVVVQRIVTACLASGLFKDASGFGLSAIPVPMVGEVLSRLLNAGVDRVCADPARFAGDISTVEWVVKNLSAVLRR